MKQIVFISILAISLFSCKKAGTGGDATLALTIKHHTDLISNLSYYRDSVFVKFNAEELPENPTTNYDLLVVGEVGEDHVHIEGLKTGKYYIYCTGLDTNGLGTNDDQRVVGGLAVRIKHSERKNEIDLNIAVAE
jgi:hypothetical protein